jgi:hypothetical protein
LILEFINQKSTQNPKIYHQKDGDSYQNKIKEIIQNTGMNF